MKEYKNKVWLENQYVKLNKTTTEISKELKCHRSIIVYWLKKFNIPMNHKKHKYNYPPKDELEHLYIEKDHTLKELSELYQIPAYTIAFILGKYQIKKANKNFRQRRKWLQLEQKGLTKEKYYDLYVNEKFSPREIAEKYGEVASYIYKLLDYWEIPKRSKAEANQLVWDKREKERLERAETFIGKKVRNIKKDIKNGKIEASEITHKEACILLSCNPGIEKLRKLCDLYGFDFQILANTYRKLEPIWHKLNEYPHINIKIALTLYYRYKIRKSICSEICHITDVSFRTFDSMLSKRIKIIHEKREDPLTLVNIRWLFANPDLPEIHNTLSGFVDRYSGYYCNIDNRDCEYISLWDHRCFKPAYYQCFYAFTKQKRKEPSTLKKRLQIS